MSARRVLRGPVSGCARADAALLAAPGRPRTLEGLVPPTSRRARPCSTGASRRRRRKGARGGAQSSEGQGLASSGVSTRWTRLGPR